MSAGSDVAATLKLSPRTVQVKAMKGDAILRLILIDHFTSENQTIDPPDLYLALTT